MSLLDIVSRRVKITDIDADGNDELIFSKLSTIYLVDLKTQKIKRKFSVHPKAEREARLSERRRLESIGNAETFLERPSHAGDIITGMTIHDVNRDGKREIVFLRTDNILGCYSTRGKELWSHYLDPYTTDFETFDIPDISVVAISRLGRLYVVLSNGKKLFVELGGDFGSPKFIRNIDNRLLLVSSEGNILIAELGIRKSVFSRDLDFKEISSQSLPGFGEPTSVFLNRHTKQLYLGFSSGKVAILSDNLELIHSLEMKDQVIGIYSYKNYYPIFVLDWLGNIAMIHDTNNIEIIPLDKVFSVDIDADGIREKIVKSAKSLRVYKGSEKLFEISGRSYITSVIAEDITGDNKKEILASWASKTISIYNLKGNIIRQFKTLIVPRRILITDINNDKKRELIILGDDGMEIYLQ